MEIWASVSSLDWIMLLINGKVEGVGFGKEGNQVFCNDCIKLDIDQDCMCTFQSHQHLHGMDKLFLHEMETWLNSILCFAFFKNTLFGKISVTISLLHIIC